MTEWCKHDYSVDTCPYCSERGVMQQYDRKVEAQNQVIALKKEVDQLKTQLRVLDPNTQVYLTQRQADYIKVKLASGMRSWTPELVSREEFINIQNDHIQAWVYPANVSSDPVAG